MIHVREANYTELPAAAQLLSRGMCDDPMHCTVFGVNAEYRRKRLHRLFKALLPLMGRRPLLAFDAERLVGVLGQFPPGSCRTPIRRQLRFAFKLRSLNVGELWRLWHWIGASEARDLAEPHWHLGPVAVESGRRGQGIGSQMLGAFCTRIDERGEVAFLETDKLDSVRFYARCGFEVREQGEVLGTPNWWMRRPARKPAAGFRNQGRRLNAAKATGCWLEELRWARCNRQYSHVRG
jgi:ribosomal protein S18 acetylase RimI-like enzyme